jgi:hypothetical protein
MPGTVVHVGAVIQCPHLAPASVVSKNIRVKVSGQFVALQSDQCLVAGCTFYSGSNPSPCTTTKWITPAVRVKVMGQPILLKDSVGVCQNPAQVPQGPPSIKVTQPRVKGT